MNCGVATAEASLCYNQFEESLYNTFDSVNAARIGQGSSRLVSTMQIPVRPMASILADVWPAGKAVRVLSIDCEGMDEEVINSHDFQKYPVEFLCVEIDSLRLDRCQNEPVYSLVAALGFIPVAKLCKSAIWVHEGCASRWGLKL